MTRLTCNISKTAMDFTAPATDWWNQVNKSTHWQDGIFFSLCGAYALVSCVALIQLIRIEVRVPEYGWTTQKVFHLMNFIINGVRAIVFGFHKQVFVFKIKLNLSLEHLIRNGYKAGALKVALKHSYVERCEFVAIFDADFQPDPDYLHRTVPYFVHNPEIGLVQTQWEFTNSRECILTRIQEVSMNFHFKVEQEVGSFAHAFFGFNGTAGVWRLTSIDEDGGWNACTTTEDMDLSLRASLQDWKFVYVSDIKVKSELPSTYKALRYQQHRWSCGPANLFRKMVMDIIRNKVCPPICFLDDT